MGQAKQRGTFEERKAAAIVRDEAEAKERKRLLALRERSMPPEQRMKRHELRTMLAFVAANNITLIRGVR